MYSMTLSNQSLLQTLNPLRIHFPRYHLSCFHHLLHHPINEYVLVPIGYHKVLILPRNPIVCAPWEPPKLSEHRVWCLPTDPLRGKSQSGHTRWSCRFPPCWGRWTLAPPPPRWPGRSGGRAGWSESGSSCPRCTPTWGKIFVRTFQRQWFSVTTHQNSCLSSV